MVGAYENRSLAGGQLRPFSAGDRASREYVTDGIRRDSLLQEGVVGKPPPVAREAGFIAIADVEKLLAAREKQLTSLKWKLVRSTRKNNVTETTISSLKEEGVRLRASAAEETEQSDALRARVTQLEENVKRKGVALRAASQRRDRMVEDAAAELSRGRGKTRDLLMALTSERGENALLKSRVEDTDARVSALEVKLQDARNKAGLATRETATEALRQTAAHARERGQLQQTIDTLEKERSLFDGKLQDACDENRRRQEAAEASEEVIRKLQAWRARVMMGEIVEMSPTEAKRLRWSEEQAETLMGANANLRSQLVETGDLLTQAEHSFDKVRGGLGDAAGTITDLSKRLDTAEKRSQKAECDNQRSKSDADDLKKRVKSLRLEMTEARRLSAGRQRAVQAATKGMEILVRGKQEETEARRHEATQRRRAERLARGAQEKILSLRWRLEEAERAAGEFNVERRVILQHLAAARHKLSTGGGGKVWEQKDSGAAMGTCGAAASSHGESCNNRVTGATAAPTTLREKTRTVLERAISDWSIKTLLQRVNYGPPRHNRKHRENVEHVDAGSASSTSCSSTGEVSDGEISGVRSRAVVGVERGVEEDIFDEIPTLDVARIYSGANRKANGDTTDGASRWELVLQDGNRNCSEAKEILALTGLENLGQAMRNSADVGAGMKVALCAVARLFNTLLLTRTLAAKQCAEVRDELAKALARLASRASTVVETRLAYRDANKRNSRLVLRLVQAEARSWRRDLSSNAERFCHSLAATASYTKARKRWGHEKGYRTGEDGAEEEITWSNQAGEVVQAPTHSDGVEEEESGPNTSSTENESSTVKSSNNAGNATDDDESSNSTERKRAFTTTHKDSINYRGGADRRVQKRQHCARKNTGYGRGIGRPRLCDGATLALSKTFVDNDTLPKVVQKLLRHIHRQQGGCGIAKRHFRYATNKDNDEVSSTNPLAASNPASGCVLKPLARLELRRNSITDAGALTLCALVEASVTLTHIDLRGNAIGQRGATALQKALANNPSVESVTVEECPADKRTGKGAGLILRAQRRRHRTTSDRARAYAFSQIPPSGLSNPKTKRTPAAAAALPAAVAAATKSRTSTDDDLPGGRPKAQRDTTNCASNMDDTLYPQAGSPTSGEHAPAFDGPSRRSAAATKKDTPTRRQLHLLEDTWSAGNNNVIEADISTTLTIDLRDCSLKKHDLLIAAAEGERAPVSKPGEARKRSLDDEKCVAPSRSIENNIVIKPQKKMKGVGGEKAGPVDIQKRHHSQGKAGGMSRNAPHCGVQPDNKRWLVGKNEGSPRTNKHMRQPLTGRRRSRKTLTHQRSEANDCEELNFLLSMSRGIFEDVNLQASALLPRDDGEGYSINDEEVEGRDRDGLPTHDKVGEVSSPGNKCTGAIAIGGVIHNTHVGSKQEQQDAPSCQTPSGEKHVSVGVTQHVRDLTGPGGASNSAEESAVVVASGGGIHDPPGDATKIVKRGCLGKDVANVSTSIKEQRGHLEGDDCRGSEQESAVCAEGVTAQECDQARDTAYEGFGTVNSLCPIPFVGARNEVGMYDQVVATAHVGIAEQTAQPEERVAVEHRSGHHLSSTEEEDHQEQQHWGYDYERETWYLTAGDNIDCNNNQNAGMGQSGENITNGWRCDEQSASWYRQHGDEIVWNNNNCAEGRNEKELHGTEHVDKAEDGEHVQRREQKHSVTVRKTDVPLSTDTPDVTPTASVSVAQDSSIGLLAHSPIDEASGVENNESDSDGREAGIPQLKFGRIPPDVPKLVEGSLGKAPGTRVSSWRKRGARRQEAAERSMNEGEEAGIEEDEAASKEAGALVAEKIRILKSALRECTRTAPTAQYP